MSGAEFPPLVAGALRYERYRETAALARLLAEHDLRFALSSLVRVPAALTMNTLASSAKRAAKTVLRPGRPSGPRPFLTASVLGAE